MQVIKPAAPAATDTARALRWHSDPVLRRIESLLDGCLQPWAARWLPAALTVRAENAPAGMRDAAGVDDPNQALLAWVYQTLFEEPLPSSCGTADELQRPSVAMTVARDAAEEWVTGLDTKLGAQTWHIQSGDQRSVSALPWSGDVVVHVTLPQTQAPALRFVIACAAIDRHLSPAATAPSNRAREPLASVIDSVARQTIAAQVFLQPVEVSVGSLLSLKAGDTLVTSHKLTEPMRVTRVGADDQGDPTLCHAHLGRRGPRRAIVLMPRTA
jgi:hypothetical protein